MNLLDANKFRREKNVQEVTSTILFSSQGTPDPKGLMSGQIFGLTRKDRRDMFGYISLKENFIHPLIYRRVLKRAFRNIDGLLQGTERFSIDENGNLVPDDKGKTGLRWFYDNFEKIKIKNIHYDEDEEDISIYKENALSLLRRSSKETLFMNILMVLPVAYRDINMTSGNMAIDELNGMYRQLLNRVKTLEENKTVVLFDADKMRFQIQMQIVQIYEHFKGIVFGKRGVQRTRLNSKNVDYGSIIVISSRDMDSDSFEDNVINIDRSGFPLASIAANGKLFIMTPIQEMLLSIPMVDKKGKVINQLDKELYYDATKIESYIDTYLHSTSERLTKILTPTEDGYVMMSYRSKGQEITRPMTITDLIYIWCYRRFELVDRNELVTRHPAMDSFNTFPTMIHVLSTNKRKAITYDGIEYPYYPDLDYIFDKYDFDDVDQAIQAETELTGYFVETQKMSLLHYRGQGADNDGDKNISRPIFSDEANAEAKEMNNKISSSFDLKMDMIKSLGKDSTQCLYSFTTFRKVAQKIPMDIYNKLRNAKPSEITKTFLFKELRIANTSNFSKLVDIHDTIKVPVGHFGVVGEDKTATLGQLILWKLLLEEVKQPLINEPWTGKVISRLGKKIGYDILDNVITMDDFKRFANRYETFSLVMGTLVNPSMSSDLLVIPDDIKALKDKLLKENQEELSKGNLIVLAKIEKELVDSIRKRYADDPALEAYVAGAGETLDNQYKNMVLIMGAMPQDNNMSKFHIVENSLAEGIKKTDLPFATNAAIIGGYSKGKSPEEGGAMANMANYVFQTVLVDKKGTDCGTNNTAKIFIKPDNIDLYIGRYIKEGNELVKLTRDNVNKYSGKYVDMRSALTCKSKDICSICAGEFLYKYYGDSIESIPIGLKLSKQQHEIVQKRLKLSHDTSLKFKALDLDSFIETP